MGRFSDLAIEKIESDEDRSYPSPERQLQWRLEELYCRREELTAVKHLCEEEYIFTDDDIHYAPQGYLNSVRDINRAIKLAKEDQKKEHGPAGGDNFALLESNVQNDNGAEQTSVLADMKFLAAAARTQEDVA